MFSPSSTDWPTIWLMDGPQVMVVCHATKIQSVWRVCRLVSSLETHLACICFIVNPGSRYSKRYCLIEPYFVKRGFNPLPDMPIIGSSNSAANKDTMSKILRNGDTIF